MLKKTDYIIQEEMETFDIPETEQIEIPEPPAKPSVPVASEDEFLDEEVKRTMGDTPINLDSPEDRSKVLYSRAVTDKKLWASTFNLGYEQYGSTKRKKRVRKYKQDDFWS